MGARILPQHATCCRPPLRILLNRGPSGHGHVTRTPALRILAFTQRDGTVVRSRPGRSPLHDEQRGLRRCGVVVRERGQGREVASRVVLARVAWYWNQRK